VPGSDDQAVESPSGPILARPAVAAGDDICSVEDDKRLGLRLAGPERVVDRSVGTRPFPLELRQPAGIGVPRSKPAVGVGQRGRISDEIEARPESRHPSPDVERHRPWIVGSKGRPRPRVAEEPLEERPADPLAQAVGSNEEVGQVPAAAGVDRRAEGRQAVALVRDQRSARRDQVTHVRAHDVDRRMRAIVSVLGQDRADLGDVGERRGPDRRDWRSFRQRHPRDSARGPRP
jgi:hypothetical protein